MYVNIQLSPIPMFPGMHVIGSGGEIWIRGTVTDFFVYLSFNQFDQFDFVICSVILECPDGQIAHGVVQRPYYRFFKG
jgi:hypothetical protein